MKAAAHPASCLLRSPWHSHAPLGSSRDAFLTSLQQLQSWKECHPLAVSKGAGLGRGAERGSPCMRTSDLREQRVLHTMQPAYRPALLNSLWPSHECFLGEKAVLQTSRGTGLVQKAEKPCAAHASVPQTCLST